MYIGGTFLYQLTFLKGVNTLNTRGETFSFQSQVVERHYILFVD